MTTTSRYTVRAYLNGEPQHTISQHRTLDAAANAAGKSFRDGSAGWDARVVVPADESVDYTARDSRGRSVNLTH